MKTTTQIIIGAIALLFSLTTYGQLQMTAAESQGKPVSSNELPASGTFWLAVGPEGKPLPPFPYPPLNLDVPIYDFGFGQYLMDDSNFDYKNGGEQQAMTSSFGPPSPGGGGSGGGSEPIPDLRRNYEKFMNQAFFLIDTNAAVLDDDTNLYSACISFPADTNTVPTLQIAPYGENAVIIKANHFDYSAETERDFALLICDAIEKPIWKTIDLQGASDSEDGWLIQGFISRHRVTDPMYFMVTNIALDCNAFFSAIPYGGPQIQLAGAEAYDVVSNTITLSATITDLSGTTNHQLTVFVDGMEPRYSLGASNTIVIDTRYTPNDFGTVSAIAANDNAFIYNLTNPPSNTKLVYEGIATLPLDFENETFVHFSGDLSDPAIVTNYTLFGVSPPHYLSATITEPESGRILKNVSGYNPSFSFVQLNWNFTETNGVTPYTNDSYVLSFTASATPGGSGTTLVMTNKIERTGVRPAGWSISNFQEVKPSSENGMGSFINSEMARWGDAAGFMYETLYFNNFASQTQYFPWEIGTNRNTPTTPHMPFRLNPTTEEGWRDFVRTSVTNRNYSDFNYGPGHADLNRMGGGEYRFSWLNYVNTIIHSDEMAGWVREGTSGVGGNKRYKMRKVTMWGCYTARLGYAPWPITFGITSSANQLRSSLGKNAGLFFNDDLRFSPYGDHPVSDVAEVAALFEKMWVGGENPYPGGANPNYSVQFALTVTKGVFPELAKAQPILIGFYYLPFAGVYDDELMVNNISKVVQ